MITLLVPYLYLAFVICGVKAALWLGDLITPKAISASSLSPDEVLDILMELDREFPAALAVPEVVVRYKSLFVKPVTPYGFEDLSLKRTRLLSYLPDVSEKNKRECRTANGTPKELVEIYGALSRIPPRPVPPKHERFES